MADDVAPADGSIVLGYRRALERAAEWCAREFRGETPPPPAVSASPTVGDVMAAYLEWMQAHRKGADITRQRVNVHILPAFGADTLIAHGEASTAPYRFTAGEIRRWHQDLAASPALFRPGNEGRKARPAPSTAEEIRQRKASANRTLTVFKAALNFAVSEGLLAKSVDVWSGVRPFRRVDRPRIRYFEAEEIARLLAACDEDFRALVTGALLTGGRYGGLIAMRARDFSAEGGYVLLTEKGQGDVARTVYLNEEGVRFFDRLSAGRKPGAFMLVRADGEPWKRSHQTRRMEAAAKAARLEPPYNCHILRHTYASLYLMNGGSLEGLARQLGHADTRMTLRAYAHLAERWRSAEAKASAPRFGIEPPTNVVRLKR